MWSRISRHVRGYGHKWVKTRKRVLERDHYLCQCERCKAGSKTTLATEVDHIVSRAKAHALGWTTAQVEAETNLQAINEECHRIKTSIETGKSEPARRVDIGLDGWPMGGE